MKRLRQLVVLAALATVLTGASSAGAAQLADRPTVVTRPILTGTARATYLLELSDGTWSGTQPITPAYHWARCSADHCAVVAGETSREYSVRTGDVGFRIVGIVTASNSAGSRTAVTDPTTIVQSAPPPVPPVTAVHANGKLAFVDNTHDPMIGFVNADGSDEHLVFPGTQPAWRPDGRRLAFVRGGAIWVADEDGSNEHAVGVGSNPSWSPDGTRFAFVLHDGPGSHDDSIWVMDADGSNAVQIAQGRSPAWSPDGQWIAFEGLATSNTVPGAFKIHPDGTGVEQIQVDHLNGYIAAATPIQWSPDSRKLLVRCDPEVSSDCVLDPATGKLTLLVASFHGAFDGSWAPDGTSIVYGWATDVAVNEFNDELWRTYPDGTGDQRVTFTPEFTEGDVSWQPVARNRVVGTSGPDLVLGLDGNDSLAGRDANDILVGGPGNDAIAGGNGDDTLLGGPGNDVLFGGPGRDVIGCGPGNDIVYTSAYETVAADCETVHH
jgi:Ca2+-binding RTX toxin-like protein